MSYTLTVFEVCLLILHYFPSGLPIGYIICLISFQVVFLLSTLIRLINSQVVFLLATLSCLINSQVVFLLTILSVLLILKRSSYWLRYLSHHFLSRLFIGCVFVAPLPKQLSYRLRYHFQQTLLWMVSTQQHCLKQICNVIYRVANIVGAINQIKDQLWTGAINLLFLHCKLRFSHS